MKLAIVLVLFANIAQAAPLDGLKLFRQIVSNTSNESMVLSKESVDAGLRCEPREVFGGQDGTLIIDTPHDCGDSWGYCPQIEEVTMMQWKHNPDVSEWAQQRTTVAETASGLRYVTQPEQLNEQSVQTVTMVKLNANQTKVVEIAVRTYEAYNAGTVLRPAIKFKSQAKETYDCVQAPVAKNAISEKQGQKQ